MDSEQGTTYDVKEDLNFLCLLFFFICIRQKIYIKIWNNILYCNCIFCQDFPSSDSVYIPLPLWHTPVICTNM